MKNLFFVFAVLLFFAACNDDNDENYEAEETFSPVVEVSHPDTVLLGENLNVMVSHTGFWGCDVYANHYVLQSDTVFTIKMYVKSTQEICTAQVIRIETPILLTFETPGAKILKFEQRDDSYLVDTVWVKE